MALCMLINASERRLLRVEKFFHLRLHRFVHFDQRWPRAFETFAGNFLRRVNAQLEVICLNLNTHVPGGGRISNPKDVMRLLGNSLRPPKIPLGFGRCYRG